MSRADRLKWDGIYSRGGASEPCPPAWLVSIGEAVPLRGRALDIAAGNGRVSRWLARRGLDVLAVDISPIGLGLAQQAAEAEGLRIETLLLDLEEEPLPDGPFDVITCFHYRQRELFPGIRDRLLPGGVFIGEVATIQNLERHTHPSLQYLAEPGELRRDCHPLEILLYQEGWFEDHATARVVAKKRQPDSGEPL